MIRVKAAGSISHRQTEARDVARRWIGRRSRAIHAIAAGLETIRVAAGTRKVGEATIVERPTIIIVTAAFALMRS